MIHREKALQNLLEESVFLEFKSIYENIIAALQKAKVRRTDHWHCEYETLNVDTLITNPNVFLQKFVNKPLFRKFKYFNHNNNSNYID